MRWPKSYVMEPEASPDDFVAALEALGRSIGGEDTTATGAGMVSKLGGLLRPNGETETCALILAPPALHIQPLLEGAAAAPAGPMRSIIGAEIRKARAEKLELPNSGSIAVNVKVKLADGEKLMISVADGGVYGDSAPEASAKIADACAAIVTWLGNPGC